METFAGTLHSAWLLMLFLAVPTALYSQTGSISLDLKNVTVRAALDEVEKQGDFSFLYSDKIVDVTRIVNVSLQKGTVEQALKQIFEGTDVTFTIKGRQIVLTSPAAQNVTESPVSQEFNTVSGKVTDSLGAPVQAVTIRIKGTTKGITTDENGNYTLTGVPSDATLIFSYVGMTSRETEVAGRKTIDITLREDKKDIDEVVVIGYGTIKKRDLTGSVSSVKASQMDLTAASSVGHALKGKVAGMSVIQNSAQPGGGLIF